MLFNADPPHHTLNEKSSGLSLKIDGKKFPTDEDVIEEMQKWMESFSSSSLEKIPVGKVWFTGKAEELSCK